MFESLLVRRTGNSEAEVDFGALAEALLFYRTVHIHFDRASLIAIVKEIGIHNLLKLIRLKKIKGTYLPMQPATISNRIDGMEHHDFGFIEQSGTQGRGNLSRREVIVELLSRNFEDRYTLYDIRSFVDGFLSLVPIKQSFTSDSNDVAIGRHARQDIEDEAYALFAAGAVIERSLPGFQMQPGWRIGSRATKHGFVIVSNIPFEKINEKIQKENPTSKTLITPALCVGLLHEVRTEIQVASQYGAELMTSPLVSKVLARKFDTVVAARLKSETQIRAFQDATIGSRDIGSVLRSGERTFDDFMSLLDRSERFRGWLQSTNPDIGLVREYQAALVQGTWAEKLPMKTTRFSIFTAGGVFADLAFVGGVGTAIGVALSAADTFIFDKLIKGWRPNQFVEKQLRPFVKE